MEKIRKLSREIRGVLRALGFRGFVRWFFCFLVSLPKVLRSGSLAAVDEAFGTRIKFRTGGKSIQIENGALGVVREIIGAHCYVEPEDIAECRTILDLGANCGVFTLFALANAPQAKVVSIEAQPELATVATANIRANGFAERSSLRNSYVGEPTPFIQGLLKRHPQVGKFDPAACIAEIGVCDFMKCDVEGAEYDLITPEALWLKKVRRLSLEYHGTWDDGAKLKVVLEKLGFEVKQFPHGKLGYLIGSRAIVG